MPSTVAQRHIIACFISSHGFGHAARTAAVLAELHKQSPSFEFVLYTQTDIRFFQSSLTFPFEYESVCADIGLCQDGPLSEDLDATLELLDEFFPFQNNLLLQLADDLVARQVALVLSDISPLGIAVATAAGLPSLLIENFRWDWIYEGYEEYAGKFAPHVKFLRKIYDQTTYHIQTEPVCERVPADMIANPISRKPTIEKTAVRERLGLSADDKMILITMGGIPDDYSFLDRLQSVDNVSFVIPVGSQKIIETIGNVVLLPHHSDYFHPDLVNASDAVIGKAGYSTIAEIYHAGIPFGYISRRNFRESKVLSDFIEERMIGVNIPEEEFLSGEWIDRVPQILGLPKITKSEINGSNQVADFIVGILK